VVANHEDLSGRDAVASPSQTLDLQPGAANAAAGQDALPPDPAAPTRRGRRATAAVLEEEGISDAELVGHLRKFGFDTPLGDQTFRALLNYENAVFLAWMNSGLIWEKIATLTHQQTGRAFRGCSNWTPDEADELRRETVTQGLMTFETSILEGWHPDRGASVKTYFTTKCLWIFLGEYKKFARGKRKPVILLDEILVPRHEPDPQDVVVARETAHLAMARLSPEMQMILQYRAESYTNREIAELIGITEKAVEGRLRRYYEGKPWEGFGDE
jgi:DNA-directed RNA polymerase specialized sigma24 family protein